MENTTVGKVTIEAAPVVGFMCCICCDFIPFDYGIGLPICMECRRRIRKTIYPEREGTNE